MRRKDAYWKSSASDQWFTPEPFYRNMEKIFGKFELDVCACEESNKAPHFFGLPDTDSLTQKWHPYKKCWMNPPYGRAIAKFMKKALYESMLGCEVVCLVPARIDTRWWYDSIWLKRCDIYFIKGRIRFVESSAMRRKRMRGNLALLLKGEPIKAEPSAAGFPCAIIHYHQIAEGDQRIGHLTNKGEVLYNIKR